MDSRLSTGIKGLDELIEGGLKPKSINLVMGESGSGKSTFAVNFLKAGADKGEAGLYVSVEEQKDKFYENMSRFGIDLAKMEAEKTFVFHKASIPEVRNFLDQGMVSFEQYFKTHNLKRVVIDSMTALMLAYSAETSQRNSLLLLFELLSKWEVTVLVTSEVEGDEARFGLQYLVDTVFRLYYRKVGQERVRTLEVMKMRGTDHSKQEIVYRIGKGGIILYPTEKILV
ncbi:MAG: ATPase domain-containing protein [Candidatus Altiarchaeota archaeon]